MQSRRQARGNVGQIPLVFDEEISVLKDPESAQITVLSQLSTYLGKTNS